MQSKKGAGGVLGGGVSAPLQNRPRADKQTEQMKIITAFYRKPPQSPQRSRKKLSLQLFECIDI